MHSYSIDIEERARVYFALLVAALIPTYFLHGPIGNVLEVFPENIRDVLDAPALAFWYSLSFFVFDRCVWKWRIWFVPLSQIPDFSGKYRGDLTGNFSNKERTIDFDLEIVQTWSRISITGTTGVSAARSGMAHISISRRELRYEYLNEPKAAHKAGYHMFRGVGFLEIISGGFLSGGYYTYNGSSPNGDIELERDGKSDDS